MWQTLAATAILLLVALIPGISGQSGSAYFVGALGLGAMLLLYTARFAIRATNVAARQLLFVSVLYLPALFALLAFDKK